VIARERPALWRCEHRYPIEVVPVGESARRARCLGCGMCGPVVREGAKEAMLALRYEARFMDKGENLALVTHHRGSLRRFQEGAAT
jgi:hypothetical protein